MSVANRGNEMSESYIAEDDSTIEFQLWRMNKPGPWIGVYDTDGKGWTIKFDSMDDFRSWRANVDAYIEAFGGDEFNE